MTPDDIALLTITAKAAVAEALAAIQVPVFRPGSVQGVSLSARTADVLIDGDSQAVTVQVLTELPYRGARVMVLFTPAGAALLVGFVTPCGSPPGTIIVYGGPVDLQTDSASATNLSALPPVGHLWCFGQAVSRSVYAALFAAVGTTYGSGDGATTFNVPDLRGRFLVGLDNMGGTRLFNIDVTTLGATSSITDGTSGVQFVNYMGLHMLIKT